MSLNDVVTEATNKTIFQKEVYKPLRDLLTVKITVPLGNPSFKHIHTNQFIFCELIDYLPVENYELIVNEMRNTTWGRHIPYEKNRWYVEGKTIINDGSKFVMELELNPFPSTLDEYDKEYGDFIEAYAKSQNGNGSNSATVSTGNSSLKGGQGETIDNLVKQICANITDDLEKCKAIHNWLMNNVIYSDYECSRYHTPENCYNNRNHINCADTAILTCSMMLSAGLNAYIVHRPFNGGHFWTIIEINGKRYASDQTGRESSGMKGSEFNTVWSWSGRKNTDPLGYDHKESGFNTCG